MFRRLRRFLRGLAELMIGNLFAALLTLQAFGIGVIYGLADCLLVGVGGVLIYFALLLSTN
jgi:hypothetical protein